MDRGRAWAPAGSGQGEGRRTHPHIFAISTVSGGSVGAVGYAAMLKAAPDADNFKLMLWRFAGENVLGGALTGMMFPDLLQRFLPVALLPDRAETLERSWEEAWAAIDPAAPSAAMMGEPFLNLAPKANEPWRPILIVQGASQDSGRAFSPAGSGSAATKSTPTISSTASATTSRPRPGP